MNVFLRFEYGVSRRASAATKMSQEFFFLKHGGGLVSADRK